MMFQVIGGSAFSILLNQDKLSDHKLKTNTQDGFQTSGWKHIPSIQNGCFLLTFVSSSYSCGSCQEH